MKMTDLAIIFVIILLPMIIVVYVNTSFVIKAEKEEMYYRAIIDSAIKDSVDAMKEIENINEEIDYGYSGIVDNKISINADVAIDAFFSSLYNNLGIKGSKTAEKELNKYIPLVAVFDYDGIYVHSAEINNNTGIIEYVTKPKQLYVYTFGIESGTMTIKDGDDLADTLVDNLIFQVVFTMDDYIYLKVYNKSEKALKGEYKFYISDEAETYYLVSHFTSISSTDIVTLKENIINQLNSVRKKVILEKVTEVLESTVNKHNEYAEDLGIKYNFSFSMDNEQDYAEQLDGIGMLAVVQGISLGNRYLNYSAYTVSTLQLSNKYLVSKSIFRNNEESAVAADRTYLSQELYHIAENCPIYQEYKFRWKNEYWELSPKFFYKKAEAATNGYIPCPVCKP